MEITSARRPVVLIAKQFQNSPGAVIGKIYPGKFSTNVRHGTAAVKGISDLNVKKSTLNRDWL